MKCKSCAFGDCYDHVDEFLDPSNRVRKCQCNDPAGRHGKLMPRKPASTKTTPMPTFQKAEWEIKLRRLADYAQQAVDKAYKYPDHEYDWRDGVAGNLEALALELKHLNVR